MSDILTTLKELNEDLLKEKKYCVEQLVLVSKAIRAINKYNAFKLNEPMPADISKQRQLQIKYRLLGKCSCGGELLDERYKTCKKCRKRGLEYYYRHKKGSCIKQSFLT